jgi:hypothetical protein
MVSPRYKMKFNTQPELRYDRLVKRLYQTINADYDVVAEAEAILAEAALISA